MDTRSRDNERLRGVAVLAALVAGILVSSVLADLGASWTSAPTETASVPPAAAPSAEPHRPAEVGMIFEVVRAHGAWRSDDRCRRLASAIYEEATQAGVDPLLVASIVAKESSFRSHAVSPAGAVGLMQLRPFVAEDLAARHDLAWDGGEMLREPTINVRLGVSYFKQLLRQFDGDRNAALTAYNFGPTRVAVALRDGTYSGSRYAREVLELYDRLAAMRTELATARAPVLASAGPV